MADDPPDEVTLVIGSGLVLAAYRRSDSAQLHARCITGAAAIGPIPILEAVPEEILKDLESDFSYEDDQDTPVVDEIPSGMVRSTTRGDDDITPPNTVAARARGTRPPRPDR
jgi:hypothetical protein